MKCGLPTISIVVPSLNQGQFLNETLESLVAQKYPNLQVVIQDAGSVDNSVEVARDFERRFPGVFQLFIEKDKGQAHGINLGFQKTQGEIMSFLNADDTLFPGCLRSAAKELDPNRHRLVVMGRCLFTGEGAPYIGMEHPCEFIDHFHQLAIWRSGINTIPQPSVFWHRSVWEKCGPLDETQRHVLDYDLFCRFGRYYRFHKVDELWSTFRIHSASKTFSRTEQEVLDMSIKVSRKNWGPWWKPLWWRCLTSLWLHNPHAFERARPHARKAEEAFQSRNYAIAFSQALATFCVSPSLGWNRLFVPFVHSHLMPRLKGFRSRRITVPVRPAGRFVDGWIGPNFEEEHKIPIDASSMLLELRYARPKMVKTKVIANINGEPRWTKEFCEATNESVNISVADKRGQNIHLQIVSSSAFVPKHYNDSTDGRVLSLMLEKIDFR
ncbi:MAG TPA: glycosyltransferase family 2 protein [Chthoniobacterales bacterium]|nr:glycosyltransferase family 2 protein [Chthoniobacterales bacterium]